MNDKQVQINFKNYTPNIEERDFVQTTMRIIKQCSPCNSYDCKVVSFGNRFTSRQNGTDTTSVMKKIKKHIDSQIDHWRATRFNNTDIFNTAS